MNARDTQELNNKLIKTPDALRIANMAVQQGDWYALSLYPIWAWLVVNGYKDVENRKWATLWRGRTLIHANGSMTMRDYEEAFKFACSIDSELAKKIPSFADCQKLAGNIIGSVKIVEMLPKPTAEYFSSAWHFEGFYGLKLSAPRAYASPVAQRGNVGFFKIESVLNPIIKNLES